MARYHSAARVVAVSHFVEQSVIQSGLSADRVSVIYDGVQIPSEISQARRESARSTLGISREFPCIANVAAFVPEKGHALLLNAFARVRAQFPECVLILRGEGPEQTRLKLLAQSLHLADAAKFLSPSIEIETVFAASDIFAFPSHEEPLGSALLAAMAHSLPVVAIARGGIPEVVEDGKNGLLMKELDSSALATAISSLLSNASEARRLGDAARETIITRFSVTRMVEETIRLYESVVAGGQQKHT